MKKIKSKKELAITLSNNGTTDFTNVSKKLYGVVKTWELQRYIRIQNNKIIGCF